MPERLQGLGGGGRFSAIKEKDERRFQTLEGAEGDAERERERDICQCFPNDLQ